jgi:diphthine-ammonia ligase
MKLKLAASWSGGKDSCLACYKAISAGFEVSYLLNMINKDAKRCMSHGLNARLISAQAQALLLEGQAMGVPMVQKEVTWDTYEKELKNAVYELKGKGVTGMVFGDMALQEHKDWIERVCAELEIKPIMPLWGGVSEQVLHEFIAEGFEAVVVSAKSDYFGPEWLGRKVDQELITELQGWEKEMGIHICGESGEYHTFVTAGPLFKKRVKILQSRKVLRDGYWFLDILSWGLD